MDVNLADLEAFNGSSYSDELGESSYADEQLGESSYADEQLGEVFLADEPFDEQFTLTGSELALADVVTGCWGAALNGTSQCCSPGFVIGKGHLKKKFCPNCVEHGFFVDARRVRAIDEASHDEFANARGAGLWTTVRTHDQEDHRYRVVNQTHLCRGPRLLVFDGEPPHSSAWAPWAAGDFVVDGFVHLRLGLGTLVPTKAAARATPAAAAPMLMPPGGAPSAVALLAAHEHLAHLAAATMAEPAHLGDDERLAIADLLPRLTTSTAALRRACGGEAAATSGAIVATMAEPPHLEGPRAPRFTWSAELHMQFEAAVAELGVDRATPQAIARLMGRVDGAGGPTRQNIKSHLQKYRLAIRKKEEAAARVVGPPAPFTAVATASGMAAGGGGPPHRPIAIATATFPVDDAPPPPPASLIFSFPPSAPGTGAAVVALGLALRILRGLARGLAPQPAAAPAVPQPADDDDAGGQRQGQRPPAAPPAAGLTAGDAGCHGAAVAWPEGDDDGGPRVRLLPHPARVLRARALAQRKGRAAVRRRARRIVDRRRRGRRLGGIPRGVGVPFPRVRPHRPPHRRARQRRRLGRKGRRRAAATGAADGGAGERAQPRAWEVVGAGRPRGPPPRADGGAQC